jgi:hypothetical protein
VVQGKTVDQQQHWRGRPAAAAFGIAQLDIADGNRCHSGILFCRRWLAGRDDILLSWQSFRAVKQGNMLELAAQPIE